MRGGRLTRARWAGLAALALAVLVALPAPAADLTDLQRRGKAIYNRGVSPSGEPIQALVGTAGIPLPASSFPCATCHGRDGKGREESGIVPSDIRWSRLSRSYGGTAAKGRRFSAYDDQSLARAITAGVDSAGNPLNEDMPRFRMAPEDLDALVAYLKVLEQDLDPGVSAQRLVFGTVLPEGGGGRPVADAVQAVIEAYFEKLNAAGGIYGRRLELVVRRAGSPEEARAAAEQLMTGGEVFALLAPFSDGLDAELAELAETHQVPVVAPFTGHAPADRTLGDYAFFLFAGPETQARALVDYAGGRMPDASIPVALVHGDGPRDARVVEAVRRQARNWGWSSLQVEPMPGTADGLEALVETQRGRGASALFFAGDGDSLSRLLEAAAAGNWTPYVYAVGAEVGSGALQAPEAFHRRIYLSYPTVPADVSPEGRSLFGRFHSENGLPRRALAAQVAAYVSARVLGEALRHQGRAVSREALVDALEGLYEYDTGLAPPITYDGARRIGVRGAHVVSLDLKRRQVAGESSWVEPR